MIASLSFGRMRPCSRSTRRSGKTSVAQPLGLGLGGLHLRAVALVDRRAHTTNACRPAATSRADQVVGVARARPGVRTAARLDRLAARRQLVEDDDVEVAVVRERERPRDRRRGHDQDVRCRRPLALQRHPLVQTEPVLLVDDRERADRGRTRPPARARACRPPGRSLPSAIPSGCAARSLPVTAPVSSA